MRLNPTRFLTTILVITILILALAAGPAEAGHKKRHVFRQQPDRYAAVVIEASTGYVLSAQNADKKLYPASLTKMMTLYLTFEALSQGRISKHQRIAVSRRAAAQEPSSLGLQAGDEIRVEDAILSIATKSANDSAVTLAEAIGGSEDRFARAMTAKARQLGMNNTRFVNASGLFKKAQVSTARDMATLSQAIIRDYPGYYRYFSTSTFAYNDNIYMNHNKLMNSYQGMDGIKTGYVYASGYNLAASAVHNGTRLIGVIFGGRTARSRNNAMAKLLNQSFARIGDIRVAALAKKAPGKTVSARRPSVIQSITEASVDNPAPSPDIASAQFDGKGLVVDQGDTDIADDGKTVLSLPVHAAPPAASAPGNRWAIQIGAFASRAASMKVLEAAKASLHGMLDGADSVAVPLMTSRGLIYRARLSGIARNDAAQACRILQGSCLILTAD